MPTPHTPDPDAAIASMRSQLPGLQHLDDEEVQGAIAESHRAVMNSSFRFRLYAEMILTGCTFFLLGGLASQSAYFWQIMAALLAVFLFLVRGRTRSLVRSAVRAELVRRFGEPAEPNGGGSAA